jgi:L-iditol 2-dehydrogenase
VVSTDPYRAIGSMWSYQLVGPMQYAAVETPRPSAETLADGSVIVEFLTGGVCGSDIARYLDGGTESAPGPVGLSLHEIVGRVVASNSDLVVGDRVVGWVGKSLGLQQYIVTEAEALAPMDPTMDEVIAIPLQPLACVLHALTRLPDDLSDVHVAIIGLGPIGLLFAHPLRDRGAASITGIDLVDRTDAAATFGLDSVEATISRAWSQQAAQRDRYDLVIEAVGHQVGTLQDAISVVAPEGTIIYFGNPDDRHYPVDFGQMMDKHVVLQTGRTPQHVRRQAMVRAQRYHERYPDVFERYISHILPIGDVQRAYEIASKAAPDRLKVILDARA